MAVKPDTVTGTITLTSGSVNFTTSGVQLQTRGHAAGDMIYSVATGAWLIIDTISGENSGTLRYNCPAACAGAGLPVTIRFQGDGSRVKAESRNLIDIIGGPNLQAEAQLSGDVDRISYYNGIGSKALAVFNSIGRALVGAADQAAARNAIFAQVAGNYVVGPASSVADRLALFDGTSGKLIKDSGRGAPAWELIGNRTATSTNYLVEYNLGAFRAIRITGWYQHSLNNDFVKLRISQDNMATWFAAGYNGFGTYQNTGSPTGVAYPNGLGYLITPVGTSNALETTFELLLLNFNKPKFTTMFSEAYFHNSTPGQTSGQMRALQNSPTAMNALWIYPENGGTISYDYLIEGIRG